MTKSFKLNDKEEQEFDAIVERSGLSNTDYIKKCVLPSSGSSVILLDGAEILAKLGVIYEKISAREAPVKELRKDISEIFAMLIKLYQTMREIEINKEGSEY